MKKVAKHEIMSFRGRGLESLCETTHRREVTANVGGGARIGAVKRDKNKKEYDEGALQLLEIRKKTKTTINNFLSKSNLDLKNSQSMEDADESQKVMSGLYGRGTYSIREVDYYLLTQNCCAGQYDAARLLQMEELEAAAMIDKKAGHDHGVYETLTLGPFNHGVQKKKANVSNITMVTLCCW